MLSDLGAADVGFAVSGFDTRFLQMGCSWCEEMSRFGTGKGPARKDCSMYLYFFINQILTVTFHVVVKNLNCYFWISYFSELLPKLQQI